MLIDTHTKASGSHWYVQVPAGASVVVVSLSTQGTDIFSSGVRQKSPSKTGSHSFSSPQFEL